MTSGTPETRSANIAPGTHLADAILTLHSREEVCRFLEDVCTIQEIKSIEQRLEVAGMLDQGVTFARISDATGASTATISRVNKALRYGANGYGLVLSRMNTDEEKGK